MAKLKRHELEERYQDSEVVKKMASRKSFGKFTPNQLAKHLSNEFVGKSKAKIDKHLKEVGVGHSDRDQFFEDMYKTKFEEWKRGLPSLSESEFKQAIKEGAQKGMRLDADTQKRIYRRINAKKKINIWEHDKQRKDEAIAAGDYVEVGLDRKDPIKGVLTGQDNKKIGAEDIGTEGVTTLSQRSTFAKAGGRGSTTTGRGLPGSGGASVIADRSGSASVGLTSGLGARKSTPPNKLGGGGTPKKSGPPIGFRPKL
jgi:hypothetical protein